MIEFSVFSLQFAVKKVYRLGLAALVLVFIPACGSPPPKEFSGAELVQRLGCLACHGLADSAAAGASYLDGIGSRLSREELTESLTHPRRRKPRVKMPSYAYVRPGEIEALVAYLERLK